MDMEARVRKLYEAGKIGREGLQKAVTDGQISAEAAAQLLEEEETEVLRTVVLAKISAACGAAITAGVDLETSRGAKHFKLEGEDQLNIMNLMNAVTLGATELPYHGDGEACDVYTAADILNLYVAEQSHIMYHTTYHNALKQYVGKLEDTDELESVQYGMELPAEYAAGVAEKLAVAAAQIAAITGTAE